MTFFPELPPEFTKKIEPLTVTAGEEKATLEIELSKGDAITKWFKNGKEIEQSGDYFISCSSVT
jgi:hypothetical protein